MMIEQKYTSPSLISKLMGVLALSCIRAVSGLTNPIHMISHPANKVDISLRLFVYTIKVQRQSYLPIYRPSGGDVTVAFLKSDLADTRNPLYEWQSSVFQRGKNMTKEEFVKTDFNFKKVFESFRVLKDNYDAFKPVPTPKTVYRTRKSQRSEVEGLEVSFEYKEVIELVVLDISLQTLKSAGSQRDLFLLEVCAALGEAKYKKNFLCVYEIEGESASYMPNYEIGKKGNFITVPLEERAFLGLHINEPDDTPMAANDSLHVQTYLDGIMVHISNQITQTLKDYSMQITSVFGDIKEEIWLSESSRIIKMLNDLEFWRKKFEMDLNLLDLHEIKETTLSNLRASFAMIHQNYKENSEKSTRKIELYSKKWVPVKFLMKYPLSLLLFIIIFTSFVLFFRSQKRNMMRVFTKNLSI